MTATILQYQIAKRQVMLNALNQAKFDANDFPYARIFDVIGDPLLPIEVDEFFKKWAKGHQAQLVFTLVHPTLTEALNDNQRWELIKFWCELYPKTVLELLRIRLERES